MDKCQECGAVVQTPKPERVGPQRFVASLVTYCDRCGSFQAGIARHIAEHGPATAPAFAYLVDYLREGGLTSKELATLLGKEPETVSRWSKEKQPFDAATWATVAAIVVDAVEGKTTTRDRLERLRAKDKHPKTVEVDIPKRTGADLREQKDEQRRAILKIVDAFVGDVTFGKRTERDWQRRERQIRLGKNRLVTPSLSPFIEKLRAEAALRPPSPPDTRTDAEIAAMYADAPEQASALDVLLNDLRAVDTRLPDAVERLGRALSDLERVRANGKIALSAHLAWEGGLEDRREGETWDDAAKRVTGRYQRSLRPTASAGRRA
jgi:hypothetical protein